MSHNIPTPEQGQLVQIRQRYWIVQDVTGGSVDDGLPMHRVRLECVDDDALGRGLDVIWEHEVGPHVHSNLGLPAPKDQWDPMRRLEAFMIATGWSLTSVLQHLPLQAPFRGAIQIEEYQLEPVVRAIQMPRVSLLVADDVGLGKTIEAGMVIQELLARQRISRILILCPASLQNQWETELQNKFSLPFEVVDRDYLGRVRREYGVHVNPWASFPRLITSFDFLKREQPLREFRAGLQRDRGGLRDWDLLVVDEAHNCAPTGRGDYVRDSDRTTMLRQLLPHFEHRIFLTATPHNGYTQSFAAMLEMLDPIRFMRCAQRIDPVQRDVVMIRRLKDDLVDPLGNRLFPKRQVLPLDVTLKQKELQLLELLDNYCTQRMDSLRSDRSRYSVQFTLTLLRKRLLSSVAAFLNSIKVHRAHMKIEAEQCDDEQLRVVNGLANRALEDFADDDDKAQAEESALIEATAASQAQTADISLVDEMERLAQELAEEADSKALSIISWIKDNILSAEAEPGRRVILFTEYRDTLDTLKRHFEAQGWGHRLLQLYGGMPKSTREAIKQRFTEEEGPNAPAILLATDAASEGINLQNLCHHLVHCEIPWNPNRMEQRNGRIDRHGQASKEVFCYHVVYSGYHDQQFLDLVVDKVRTQREDLGAVGDVIAAKVEEAFLSKRPPAMVKSGRAELAREEMAVQRQTRESIAALRQEVLRARKSWRFDAESQRLVLEEALLMASPSCRLIPVESGPLAGKAWLLPQPPMAWRECHDGLYDAKGALRPIVFDDRLIRKTPHALLMHLNHPLMRRALGLFRANLWSDGLHESHKMARVSYRLVDNRQVERPLIILAGRLVVPGTTGARLHEELLLVGGHFHQTQIDPLDHSALASVMELPASHPPLPSSVADALRRSFAGGHKRTLQTLLTEAAKRRHKEVVSQLTQLADKEAKAVKEMVQQRMKEARKRITEMERDLGAPQRFLPGLDPIGLDQYDQDLKFLRNRVTTLQSELESEPALAKARYQARPEVSCFPLALLYVIPSSLVEEVL